MTLQVSIIIFDFGLMLLGFTSKKKLFSPMAEFDVTQTSTFYVYILTSCDIFFFGIKYKNVFFLDFKKRKK